MILALLVGLAAIRVSAELHDAVPSSIRSGVASGVSSLSWLVFLPVALGFGALSAAHGVHTAGWLLVAATALASGLVAAIVHQQQPKAQDDPSLRDAVPAGDGVASSGDRLKDLAPVCAHAENGSAVLEVADTGPGIPADELPHVFDRL